MDAMHVPHADSSHPVGMIPVGQHVHVVLVMGPVYDALALGGRQLARIYRAIDR